MHLLGRHYHALEQKGRLSIPAPYRDELGNKIVITIGLDGCLFLLSLSKWQELTQDYLKLPYTSQKVRDWIRLMANNASIVSFDSVGRVLIPEQLRTKAKLTKQTVVVGSIDRVEIWDQVIYHQYLDDLESNKEDIAEDLSKILIQMKGKTE